MGSRFSGPKIDQCHCRMVVDKAALRGGHSLRFLTYSGGTITGSQGFWAPPAAGIVGD